MRGIRFDIATLPIPGSFLSASCWPRAVDRLPAGNDLVPCLLGDKTELFVFAYHKDGKDTLKVQLKSRLTIDKKYIGKGLFVTFPVKKSWCLIEHDTLVDVVRDSTNWLNTESWRAKGIYHSDAPSAALLARLDDYVLKGA